MPLVRWSVEDDRCIVSTAMTREAHATAIRTAHVQATLPAWGCVCSSGMGRAARRRAWRRSWTACVARGVDATRHRSAEAQGRGRGAGLPSRRARASPDVAVGGHSYGGRVASLAAAEPDSPYAALVLFSYPLHPPGAPERTDARIAHWPSIRCPVLLLSGEADPFAKIDLLRATVPRLADAELVTYPRLGHTLKPVLGRRPGPRRGLPRDRQAAAG